MAQGPRRIIVFDADSAEARSAAKELDGAGVALSREADALGYLSEHQGGVRAVIVREPAGNPGLRAFLDTVRALYPLVKILIRADGVSIRDLAAQVSGEG